MYNLRKDKTHGVAGAADMPSGSRMIPSPPGTTSAMFSGNMSFFSLTGTGVSVFDRFVDLSSLRGDVTRCDILKRLKVDDI
jgi:hypothetical protein